MAIQYNENIKIAAPAPLDKRYLSERTIGGSPVPYSACTEVNTVIIPSERYTGLTVNIAGVEYWYKDGVLDACLIEKKYDSAIPEGDFVTGATNIGYFSGKTGIQTLYIDASGSANDGNYYSLYNYYYVNCSGVISIPADDGSDVSVLRRGYVRTCNPSVIKSWIFSCANVSGYNVGWQLVDGDISKCVGGFIAPIPYVGLQYQEEEWLYNGGIGGTGFYNSGGTLTVQVYGSLTTGDTITIGGRPYAYFDHNNLHFRTIISDTPNIISVTDNDAFIRISGATPIFTGANVGSGTGQVLKTPVTGTTLNFRTLRGSGDTTVTTIGNEIVIFASISGQTSITGATNIGFSGGTGVFDSRDDKTLQFRNLVGSGDTTVSLSGDSVVIHTVGGEVFTEDLYVSIAAGKTFGKYENGDTIPAIGKTPADVIKMAILEALEPTVNLSSSGDNVAFGESGKTVNLNFSYIINTLGASVDSVLLEWRRGGTGSWSGLTTNTGATSYMHNIDDSVNRFNTAILNYRYTVIDTAGATGVTTYNVTPQAYAAPTILLSLNGTITSPETQTVREKGNVISSPSGSINSNRSLVDITAWTLERRYDGSGWIIVASGTGLQQQSVTISATLDNTVPTGAVTIDYRIGYTDEYTTNYGSTTQITFKYFSYWGFNTNTTVTESQIEAFAYKNFLASDNLTWNNINTPVGNYTYYAYPSTYPDFSSVIKNGVLQDFGAWQQLSPVNVTNTYGESLNYKVWRTNATLAYGATDSIVIS